VRLGIDRDTAARVIRRCTSIESRALSHKMDTAQNISHTVTQLEVCPAEVFQMTVLQV
jgi:hypothetical protein